MNERIKLLAEQSLPNVKFWNEEITKGNTPPKGRAITLDELEKFAELLIRECAELSVNSRYANTKSEYYEGFNEALVYVGNKIKQHFGVEE